MLFRSKAIPEVLGRSIGLETAAGWQPRPTIIAYGHATNPIYFEPADEREAAFRTRPDLGFKRFGIVGVYDGDPANIGRVVCDSTWHHWFSPNLFSIAAGDPAAYQMMQSYYRNVAMWLAKLPLRQRSLTAAVWNVLTQSSPMEFTARQTAWEMGERAIELLLPLMGPCWVNELVAAQFDATSLYRIAKPEDSAREPQWSRVPEGLVNKAVVGSLAKALYPLASQLRLERNRRKDVQADPQAIDKLAAAGLTVVPDLLKETLSVALTSLTQLREGLVSR